MFAGCGSTRIVEKPVPVEIEVTKLIPVPAELLITRPPQSIPLGDGEFSGATYGDILVILGKDRASLDACNAQLEAIGELNEAAE